MRRLTSKVYTEQEVRAVVRFELDRNLPKQLKAADLYGRQADNRKYAGNIKGLVKDLLQSLRRLPQEHKTHC